MQRLLALVAPLIAPTPADIDSKTQPFVVPGPLCDAARELFVSLPVCAPKNSSGEEWVKSLQTVITSAQSTADRVFRSFVEDWRPRSEGMDVSSLAMNEVVCDEHPEPSMIPSWKGIHAGIERLDGLLHTVQAFLSFKTSSAVALPVGSIMSLISRILSATLTSGTRGSRMRPEIEREEREGLEVALPRLHVSAMTITSYLMSRIGGAYTTLSQNTLQQILWVFDLEQGDAKVREVTYRVLSQNLEAFGLALPISFASPIARCIKMCCEDLLSSRELLTSENVGPPSNGGRVGKKPVSTNADSYLKSTPTGSGTRTNPSDVASAAEALLPLTLTNLPTNFLAMAVRTQIDRTAILTENKRAMLASVMNPPSKMKGVQPAPSIIPMLARAHMGELGFEALLRPQMPVVRPRKTDIDGTDPDAEVENLNGRGPTVVPYAQNISNAYNFEDGMLSESGSAGAATSSKKNTRSDSEGHISLDKKISESQDRFSATLNQTDDTNEAVSAMNGNEQPITNLSPADSFQEQVSNKRDHEMFTAANSDSNEAGVTMSLGEGSNKRPRLAQSPSGRDNQAGLYVSEDTIGTDSPAAAIGSQPVLIQSGTQSEPDVETGSTDSEEIEFDMPSLHLSSDTDDESENEAG